MNWLLLKLNLKKENTIPRTNQHPVGRVVASTKAKVDSTISGTEYHASKRGGYKAGNNRYQTSSKSADVTTLIRDNK